MNNSPESDASPPGETPSEQAASFIHQSASSGYQREANTYAKARPSYHPALVQRFVERFAGAAGDQAAAVEIGAGTGIFTAQLVNAGCTPTAIEPVAAMQAELTAALPDVRVMAGTASGTGLLTDAATTVVASQSFHWFDHRLALDEIARILRPAGHLVTVWNVRDETVPWVGAYTEIMDRHAGTTPRYRTMEWRHAIDSDERFVPVDEWSVANPRPTTPEGVVDRGLSTSFIAALSPAKQAQVRTDLLAAVSALGENFDYPYRSELQAWQLRE